jgi:hypothetical protein
LPNLKQKLPKVYIAIPTGPRKEYSLLLQLAMLRNLDYPMDRLSINFGVTTFDNAECQQFRQRIEQLVQASNFKCETSISITCPNDEELLRWGTYALVVVNLHALRLKFLQGDYDYFWVLGGDNIPERGLLKNLLKMDVDVASPLMAYRPIFGLYATLTEKI